MWCQALVQYISPSYISETKCFEIQLSQRRGPPKISLKQELPLSHPQPPTLTPREERQRKQDERRAELPDAQESTESEKEKEEE